MDSSPRGDRFARVVGFLVFLLGVAIILGTLWLALQMFQDPHLGRRVATPQTDPPLTDLGVGFGQLLFRIALLFLGSLSGSLIANKGIQMYFAGLPPKAEG